MLSSIRRSLQWFHSWMWLRTSSKPSVLPSCASFELPSVSKHGKASCRSFCMLHVKPFVIRWSNPFSRLGCFCIEHRHSLQCWKSRPIHCGWLPLAPGQCYLWGWYCSTTTMLETVCEITCGCVVNAITLSQLWFRQIAWTTPSKTQFSLA